MLLEQINRKIQNWLVNRQSTDMSFREYLLQLFDCYVDILRQLANDLDPYMTIVYPLDDIIQEVKQSCKTIIDIFDSYQSGYIGNAIDAMKQEFLAEEEIFAEEVIKSSIFFRARKIDPSAGTLQPKEMFHVPFEQRYKIQNYRYNIAGYPCLYLGSSILACWEEMDKPNPDNLCVAMYSLSKESSLNVIDLCVDTSILDNWGTLDEEEQGLRKMQLMRLLRRWPLIIACSIRAQHKDATYKEEYVIPQLLMLSIVGNEHVDGIKYISSKMDDQIAGDSLLHTNYVFPTQKITNVGYCSRLAGAFCLSQGVTFMEADIRYVFHHRGTNTVEVVDQMLCINDLDVGKSDYQCTKFGQMEDYLSKLEKSQIQ